MSPAENTRVRPSRFAVWRVVSWLLLLVAAFSVLEYTLYAWHASSALLSGDTGGKHAEVVTALVWHIVSLAAACATVMAATGVVLRREWARRVLRVLAVLLAVWMLVSIVMLGWQWHDFSVHSQKLLQQNDASALSHGVLARMRRDYEIAIAVKVGLEAIAVPVLAWLSWRLGKPAVRQQFSRRKGE